MADNEVLQEEAKSVKSNTVTVLVENETPVIVSEEANGSDGKSRSSSIAWSSTPSLNQRSTEKFRSLKRRSSVENFGQFGFLVPALSLVPQADGADALTQQFGDLQGTHRELKLASAHIDDALKGRGSYGKARSYFKPRLAQKCFDILDNPWFRYLIIWNSLLHSFLIFFEPPTIQVLRVHPIVYVLNMSCIMLFIFDLVVHIIFLTWPVFWSRRTEGGWWNGVEFVLVCFFTVDFVLLVISRFLGEYIPPIFRSFRLALILCKVKNIQHIFNVLMTIGFKLSKLFFIILVFVLMCACIGVHVLMDAYQCNGPLDNSSSTTAHHGKTVPCYVQSEEKVYQGAFDHVAFGMLKLFVLLSTENFPEVMLPALRVESAYFIYFGLFVFVGVFFLTAILLAIVVDSYWVYSKKHVKKERARERAELAKAWNLLDPLGKGALSLEDEKFTLLFHLLKPKNSDAENLVLIEMLDTNEDGEVDSFEWTTMLSKVLSLEFEDDDDLLLLDETPGLSKWMISTRESAKSLSESILFSRFILFLIIVHCILFAFKWKGQDKQIEFIVQVFRSVIVTIFLIEGGTRLVALGRRILQPQEILDLLLVVLAFCSNFVWYTYYPDFFWFRDYATTISSLAVFCRLPFNNSQLKQAVSIFSRIAPVMVDLLCLLGIILFLLASVGMELFHDVSETSEGHMYLPACGLGFQTFWCACLILFQMVTTSNWHEIMNSVMEATRSNWTSLYFVAAYILVNMVIMNLFVAIAIEAFNKLGTLDEDQPQLRPHIERQASDQYHFTTTSDVSMKHQAVHMISSVASSLFGSVRADQVAERRQSLTAADAFNFQVRRGTIKRGSIMKHRQASIEKNAEGDKKEDDEVFVQEGNVREKGDKRERVLKMRMKEKKRAKQKMANAEHKVRVATAFRGNRETDLDLQVGDEVTVLVKKDDWWQGRCRSKVGWFPASHVILRTVKAVPEYGKHRSRKSTAGTSGESPSPSPIAAEDENANSKVQDLVKEKSSSSLGRKENTFFRDRSSTSGSQVPSTPPAVRGRVKLKKTGDWRREILGDMTVMNAEELRELNSIMRAELRTPTGLRSKRLGPLRLNGDDDSIRECFISEDHELVEINQGRPNSALDPRPYSGRYLGRSSSPRFSQNSVGPLNRLRTESGSSSERSPSSAKIPSVEFFSPGTPTPPSTTTEQLSSSSANSARLSSSPKLSPKQKRPVEKPKNGEMPQWMKNFVETNNLVVGKDIKLDESKAEGRRGSSTSPSGTGTTKSGTKTKTGSKSSRSGSPRGSGSPRSSGGTSGTKSRSSPGVAKKGGTSPVGSRSPGGRPVTPGKGLNRQSVS